MLSLPLHTIVSCDILTTHCPVNHKVKGCNNIKPKWHKGVKGKQFESDQIEVYLSCLYSEYCGYRIEAFKKKQAWEWNCICNFWSAIYHELETTFVLAWGTGNYRKKHVTFDFFHFCSILCVAVYNSNVFFSSPNVISLSF